ncbi:hypothetical protein MKW92_022849 [Papaver armeniacum]|nr:hypothetical protein MKW92_022849 [Papaver armeniacum]
MATSILHRCARSALRSTDLATRCVIRYHAGNMARLFSSKSPNTVVTLELEEYHKVFEVTDDIVNSEAKLRALFLKWLSHNEGQFVIEDEVAFKERFQIFKDHARSVNAWNKGGPISDSINEDLSSWQINLEKDGLRRKVNQVTIGGVKFIC